MLTEQHIKECLSRAFIYAIGGRAGVDVALGEGHDYGVDGTLRLVEEIEGRRVKTGIALDIQLKASVNWIEKDGKIVYDLKSKNYNDLIRRSEGVNLVLILLCLPRSEHLWLAADDMQMIMRHCCYWFRPTGSTVPKNSTKRIHIPTANRVSRHNISELIDKARGWEIGQ